MGRRDDSGSEPGIKPPRRWMKLIWLVGGAVAVSAVLLAGALSILPRWEYTPSEPPKILRQFVELIERGDLRNAYLLTNEGALVGTTFPKFEDNIRWEFGITQFPIHRPIREIFQKTAGLSYGSILRLWWHGRKAGFDQIGYDVYFADHELPSSVAISLKLDRNGQWRIKYFEGDPFRYRPRS